MAPLPPRLLAPAAVPLLALTLAACGRRDNDTAQGPPPDAGAEDAAASDGAAVATSLRVSLAGARAVGTLRETSAGAAGGRFRAVYSLPDLPGRRLLGGSAAPLPPLFAVDDEGAVHPALTAPPGLELQRVQFVLRVPETDALLVSFAYPLEEWRSEDGGAPSPIRHGSFFRAHPDGSLERIGDAEGVVAARRRDIFAAGLDEDFEPTDPYQIDPAGRVYFVWRDADFQQTLLRYDSATGELEPVVEAPEGREYYFGDFRLTPDGAYLVIRAVDQGGHADDPDSHRVTLRRYALDGGGDFVELVPPGAFRNSTIQGMQVTDDARTAFFSALSIPGYEGVVRADVGDTGEVSWTLLYEARSRHAPVNYTATHYDYEDGFFDKQYDAALERWQLVWNERWYVGGDASSGELDAEAVMARAAPYFTTEVELAFGGERGPPALAAFLAAQPYEWEDILGVPVTTPEPPDHYSWHFLEHYFVQAGTGDPPATVASFAEPRGLIGHNDWVRFGNLYLDGDGAPWALMHSEWNDVALRWGRIQPLRLTDAAGERALADVGSVAPGSAMQPVAWRLGRGGEALFFAHHTPAPDPADRGTHQLFRLAPGDPAAEPEDVFAEVPGPLTVLDFSLGQSSLYFVGYDAAGARGGWIDLETLAHTPLADAVPLETLDEL